MGSGIVLNNRIQNGGFIPEIIQDILSARPAPGIFHRWFVTTDQTPNKIFRDDVTVWTQIFPAGGGGTLTGADNGLHVQGGNTVELGGTLIKDTDIDPATFHLTLNNASNPNEPFFFFSKSADGGSYIGVVDGAGLQCYVNVNDTAINGVTPSGGTFQYIDGTFTITKSADGGTPYVEFQRNNTLFKDLINLVSTAFVQADATGKLSNVDITSVLPVTGADNGLSLAAGVVELGGTLIKDTNIVAAAFPLNVNETTLPGQPLLNMTPGIDDNLQVIIGILDNESLQTQLTINVNGYSFTTTGPSITFSPTFIQFVILANIIATAFLQADAAGNITNVDAAAALAGAFIDNQTSLQDPANFNIHGQGQLNNDETNSSTGIHALLPITTFNWTGATAIANGALYASTFNWVKHEFSSSETFPSSASSQAFFSRLQLDGLVNSTITMVYGAGSKVRALSAIGGQIYLPPVAGGVVVTVSDVAGVVTPSAFQDAGTTNSVLITNFYGLLIPQVDEGNPFVAITNKFAIFQDGVNDQNLLRGPIQLKKIAAASGSNLTQIDTAGNLTSGIIYQDVAEQAIPGVNISFDGVAPTVATALTYRWSQTGNKVTVRLNTLYGTPGVANTKIVIVFMADLPAPAFPTGFSVAASCSIYAGSGNVGVAQVAVNNASFQVQYDQPNGHFIFAGNFASIAATNFLGTIEYYTT